MGSDMNAQTKQMGIWLAIGIGALVGVGIAMSRRKKTPWEDARGVTKRLGDRSGEMADTTRDIVDRVKTIYEESRRVIEDAGELWEHGRKLVGV